LAQARPIDLSPDVEAAHNRFAEQVLWSLPGWSRLSYFLLVAPLIPPNAPKGTLANARPTLMTPS